MAKKQKAEELKFQYSNWKADKIRNKDGFFPVWNEFKRFLPTSELSGGALRLYLFLGLSSKNLTGESWYTIETLKKELNCSNKSVNKWIKELQNKGLIARLQHRFGGVTYTYLLPYDKGTMNKQEEK